MRRLIKWVRAQFRRHKFNPLPEKSLCEAGPYSFYIKWHKCKNCGWRLSYDINKKGIPWRYLFGCPGKPSSQKDKAIIKARAGETLEKGELVTLTKRGIFRRRKAHKAKREN